MKRKLTKLSKETDVRPLPEREPKMNTRKGLSRTSNNHHKADSIQTENPIHDLLRP
jgi:hypothetical protein